MKQDVEISQYKKSMCDPSRVTKFKAEMSVNMTRYQLWTIKSLCAHCVILIIRLLSIPYGRDERLRSVINCDATNIVILAACAEDMNHVFDGWFAPSPLQVCLTCHKFDELRNKSQTHDHCPWLNH